jgi:diaminobutyrate acetyltransferase
MAFLSKMSTIAKANEKVESVITALDGTFHHRSDIGTAALIDSKVAQVKKMNRSNFEVRIAEEGDFLDLSEFVTRCKPLENYADHLYKIMLRYVGNTCFMLENLESDRKIVGFVMGLISQTHTPCTYFLWQIGIDPTLQGKGLGRKLLEEIETPLKKRKCRRIEVTIDPENRPSRILFERMGYRNISKKEGPVVMVDGNQAVKDYYRPGRHFMLFEKWL